MSVKVSSWVWHGDETAELAGNEMILLLALADVAADDGRCIYLTEDDELTYAGLAKKARVDRRTVIRLVAKLRERGLLQQTKGTRGQPNEFAIAVPWRRGDKLSPVESVTSETDSVTDDAETGDNSHTHSSYRRTDVSTRGGAAKRGTRIADPFIVTSSMREWAAEHTPLVNVDRATLRFVNYWRAKTGKDATKLDWERTWQNWLLKDQEDQERRPGVKSSTVDHGREVDRILRERAAGEQLAVTA